MKDLTKLLVTLGMTSGGVLIGKLGQVYSFENLKYLGVVLVGGGIVYMVSTKNYRSYHKGEFDE